MKNYIDSGTNPTVAAPTGGVVSGQVVVVGAMIGVATASAAAGDDVTLRTQGNFGDMPKATGAAWAVGDALYWDATAKKFTTTATNNKLAGIATAAAVSGDLVGCVKLANALMV